MATHPAERKDPRPRARDDDLIVREVAEETLVYDRRTHQAHCLSPLLTRVWRACDGEKTASEMAETLGTDSGQLDERLVAIALQRLRRARLVDLAPQGRPSRRELLQRTGGLAGLTLVSICAPTPLAAASCTPPGECVALPDASCTGLPCCDDPTKSCRRQGGGRNCTCR